MSSPYIYPEERFRDEEEILPGWTWGEHREMEKMLAELEGESPTVKKAREALDARLIEAGLMTEDHTRIRICRHCWKQEGVKHDEECPEHIDPRLFVKREAGGYQYLTDLLVVAHTTSVPMTDEEAVEYFPVVQLMFTDDTVIQYITRREVLGHEYKMLPWQFDKEAWEVRPIVRSGS